MEKYSDPIFIVICIGFGLPYFIFWTRKKEWFDEKFIYGFTGSLMLLGFIFGFFIAPGAYFTAWCLACPLFVFFIERNLKKFSEHKRGRDYILWMKYSDEIEWSRRPENPDITWLDRRISILLGFMAPIMVAVGAGLFN